MAMILDGSNGVTFNDASLQGAAASPYVLKNRIINGAMVIDQRNAGASGTAIAFTIDRWGYGATQASKGTWQQNAGSVTPPAGFQNYWGFTSSSAYSVTASDQFYFYQGIEGYNVADLGLGASGASTFTISFWVRSSLTGTFGASVQNSAQNRSYPFSYTISSANTWEQKTITIVGDTSGTWLKTNGCGMYLLFSLGMGSTYSGTANTWAGSNYIAPTGATSVVGTNGATFYITGVQLEVGTTATPFERRLYNQELANCQRYYQKFGTYNVYAAFGSGFCYSTTAASVYIKYTTAMRAAPTLSQSLCAFYQNGNITAIAGLASQYTGTDSIMLQATVASGFTVDKPCLLVANNTNAAYLDLSAEL
jgi:hypothetical protein